MPISNYTTKLQSLKQYGSGTKIDTLIEQNRESKDKPIFMWSINLKQRRQEYTMGKDNLFNNWC